jgi:hypothetical protein
MVIVRKYKLQVKLKYCPNNEDKQLWQRGRWQGCITDFEKAKTIAADLAALPQVKEVLLIEVGERVVWPYETSYLA